MRHISSRSRQALRLLGATLAAVTAPAASAAQNPAAPDYSAFSAARFIRFVNAANDSSFAVSPVVEFWVNGKRFQVTMDTGSTGILLSSSVIPGYTADSAAKYPRGYEYLSSSDRLYLGHWFPTSVTFVDSTRGTVTAHVKVLAVDSSGVCAGYTGNGTCHRLVRDTGVVMYMGVGFGREYNGQPQGTPDKNAFLNVAEIDDVTVAPGTLRNGYVITKTGVQLGLTPANTAGFAYVKLSPASTLLHDWAQAPMCVEINGSRCLPGAVLFDTGIPQMYATVAPLPVDTVRVHFPHTSPNLVTAFAPGTRVTVRFPDAANPVAWYGFTVSGTGNPLAPAMPIVAHDSATFVNTGLHFYRGFQVLYDADGGWLGLRWIGPANSPNGGTAAAP